MWLFAQKNMDLTSAKIWGCKPTDMRMLTCSHRNLLDFRISWCLWMSAMKDAWSHVIQFRKDNMSLEMTQNCSYLTWRVCRTQGKRCDNIFFHVFWCLRRGKMNYIVGLAKKKYGWMIRVSTCWHGKWHSTIETSPKWPCLSSLEFSE